jgi:hypothetical protein
MLATREIACKEINEKYGLNVSVTMRKYSKEGEQNEQIHNSSENAE